MKPAPFEYYRPPTMDAALSLLYEHGRGAKILAGGQSLIPTMNFRLAQPSVLVDLRDLGELSGVGSQGDAVSVGAMTTQRAVERSDLVRERAPLLHEAMPFIAHPQIRNQGTVGGSLAHADPAGELPAVALALNATMEMRGSGGSRTVRAGEFFTGLFATALSHDEILTGMRIDPPRPHQGFAFTEIARRHGDYALVGVAVAVELDAAGHCADARIALLSVGDGPVLAESAGAVVRGESPSPELARAASHAAAYQDINPPGDIHASARYRRHLADVLTRRALLEAFERAASTGKLG